MTIVQSMKAGNCHPPLQILMQISRFQQVPIKIPIFNDSQATGNEFPLFTQIVYSVTKLTTQDLCLLLSWMDAKIAHMLET